MTFPHNNKIVHYNKIFIQKTGYSTYLELVKISGSYVN